MTHLEDTMLPLGKGMIYRPSEDIHIQIPPDHPSMSLNLLIAEDEIVEVPQYFFDLEKSQIVIMNDNEIGRQYRLSSKRSVISPTRIAHLCCSMSRAEARAPPFALQPSTRSAPGFPSAVTK